MRHVDQQQAIVLLTYIVVLCYQVDDTSRITPCIDNLAQVLVENLTGRSGNPDLALLADRLLHSMLLRFPQLLWSAPVMQALLVELQREEGALYLSGAKPRLTLARVLRIRRKTKKVPLPAWTWIIRVGIHFWSLYVYIQPFQHVGLFVVRVVIADVMFDFLNSVKDLGTIPSSYLLNFVKAQVP